MHNAVAPGLGKIGVLVGLESTGDKAKLAALGKQVAMHVAAANPQALSADADRSRRRSTASAPSCRAGAASGKPAEIIAKMVEGRLRKYYEEVVLLEQALCHRRQEPREAGRSRQAAKDIGAPVKIAGFARFALGEGIEKEQADAA